MKKMNWYIDALVFIFQIICFMHGCRIGFFRGDVKLLTDDMQALKPTLFITVPRLLNRIYDRVSIKRKTNQVNAIIFIC